MAPLKRLHSTPTKKNNHKTTSKPLPPPPQPPNRKKEIVRVRYKNSSNPNLLCSTDSSAFRVQKLKMTKKLESSADQTFHPQAVDKSSRDQFEFLNSMQRVLKLDSKEAIRNLKTLPAPTRYFQAVLCYLKTSIHKEHGYTKESIINAKAAVRFAPRSMYLRFLLVKLHVKDAGTSKDFEEILKECEEALEISSADEFDMILMGDKIRVSSDPGGGGIDEQLQSYLEAAKIRLDELANEVHLQVGADPVHMSQGAVITYTNNGTEEICVDNKAEDTGASTLSTIQKENARRLIADISTSMDELEADFRRCIAALRAEMAILEKCVVDLKVET